MNIGSRPPKQSPHNARGHGSESEPGRSCCNGSSNGHAPAAVATATATAMGSTRVEGSCNGDPADETGLSIENFPLVPASLPDTADGFPSVRAASSPLGKVFGGPKDRDCVLNGAAVERESRLEIQWREKDGGPTMGQRWPAAAPASSSIPPTTTTTTTIATAQTPTQTPSKVPLAATTVSLIQPHPHLLTPPDNFAMVAPGIYRSAFPTPQSFAFLQHLHLTSVLVLALEPYPDPHHAFLKRHGIKLVHEGVPGNKEPFVTTPYERMARALGVLLDRRNFPILVHCNKGKHRTGCLIGLLRRCQRWAPTSIFEEYRRFSYPKERFMDQVFIEMFELDQAMGYVDGQWVPEWLQQPVFLTSGGLE